VLVNIFITWSIPIKKYGAISGAAAIQPISENLSSNNRNNDPRNFYSDLIDEVSDQ